MKKTILVIICSLMLIGCVNTLTESTEVNPEAVTEEISTEVERVIEVDEVIEEAEEEEKLTLGQKNAIASAESYLSFMGFSRHGLIIQLSSEYGDGYTVEEAEFAVQYLEDNGLVDWKEQATRSANSYLQTMSFSREGLKEQLTSEYGEGFTEEETEYALKAVGY